MAEQVTELTTLDIIEGKLRKVRGDVEARKSGTSRPRSLNLTTLYCSEVPAAQPSPLSLATIPATPAPSLNSSVSVTSPSPAIFVRHRPLSPPALRLQRSVSSHSQYSQHQPTPQQRRALYRQASAGSSLRRKRAYSQRRCTRVCRWISEISWLLVGLRHLVVEVPLLIVLALNHGVGLLFYLTLAATLAPGPAALISVIKSGVAQGTSILHSIVRCVALTLRLESLLRLVELMVWWRGGAAWRSHVNIAQAGAGSTPQLILQVTALGLCTRQILDEQNDEGHFFKSYGMNYVFEYEKNSSLCDPSIVALQCWVATVSALHIAWALSVTSRPKLPPNCSVDPSVWVLVRRISAGVGVIANLLLSGSRMALVMLAVSLGWPTWNIAVTFTCMLSIMLLAQLIRRCCSKSTQDIAMIACSLVAIEPGALSPRILARRCVIFVAGNVAMVVAIALRTHGAEASGQVYRVAVLHAAAATTGTLLLFARLRWVHSTPAAPSPRQGGKCLSQYPLQDDI